MVHQDVCSSDKANLETGPGLLSTARQRPGQRDEPGRQPGPRANPRRTNNLAVQFLDRFVQRPVEMVGPE